MNLCDSLSRYADYLGRRKLESTNDHKKLKGAADRETYEVLGQKTQILPGPMSRCIILSTLLDFYPQIAAVCRDEEVEELLQSLIFLLMHTVTIPKIQT